MSHLQDVEASEVVVDGNLVTAPAWPAHPKWLAAFVDVLGYKVGWGWLRGAGIVSE